MGMKTEGELEFSRAKWQLLSKKERDLIAPCTRHREAPPRKTRQAAPIWRDSSVFLGRLEIRGFGAAQ